MEIGAKIQTLVNTSLFLSSDQRERLLNILKTADASTKEGLLSLLNEEKSYMLGVMKQFLEKTKDEGMADLDAFIRKSTSKVRGEAESISGKEDDDEMGGLLDQLNES